MKTSLQLPLSIVFIFLHVVTRRTVSSLDPGDEGKPYRFGFTIDGEQHRHESRDINGIVKGEFGFITGDGVYHVTAYATDENGNFRIVSTKNIKISEPLDQLDANAKTSGIQLPKITQREDVEVVEQPLPNQRPHEALVQSAPPADEPFDYVERKQMYSDDDDVDNSPVTTPSSSPSAYPFTLASTRAVGCSGCGIPAPTDKPQKMMFQTREFQSPPHDDKTQKGRDFSKENAQLTAANDGNNFPNNGNNFGNDGDNFPNNGNNFANNGNNFANNGNNFRNKGIGNVQSKTNYEGANGFDGNQPSIDPKLRNSNVPGTYRNSPSPNDGASVEIIGEVGDTRSSPLFDLRNGNSPRPGLSSVIVDETNGRIIVPNNKPIPIEDKYPNMAKGLPPGIEDKDILDLLYRFNYTFNFHGHYETGYKDGTKIGGYFVNGRDGISRVVTYVADEFGYRPKFKLVNLGLESPDTPKEETERKEFKLKSFEFVWFPIR